MVFATPPCYNGTMTQMIDKPTMTRNQLDRHFRDAIDYLDRRYAHFLTYVVKIGRPEWTHNIPTAAVALKNHEDAAKKDEEETYVFQFLFNPDFAATLSVPEFAFVISHEALHILLNHLRLASEFSDHARHHELAEKYNKREKMTKEEIKELIEIQQIHAKWNIAADCVINDFLANNGFVLPVKEDGSDAACRGKNYIGENAAYLTVKEVFDRLPEQEQGKRDTRGDGAIDSHDWIFDPSFGDTVIEELDKIYEDMDEAVGAPQDLKDRKDEEATGETQGQRDISKMMQHGTEAGNIEAFVEQAGVALAWAKLMKEIDPDIFKEPGMGPPPKAEWHKRPRKLAAREFRNTNLPIYGKNRRREKKATEKPAIVLALDTSASIGEKDSQRFLTLAKSIPQERIKLFCCTFNTYYMKFDPQMDTQTQIGGGTNFDAVVSFINDHVKPELKGKYPKAVVVITDGMAHLSKHLHPDEKEAESWLWLLSPQDGASASYPASKEIGRRAMLEEFIA